MGLFSGKCTSAARLDGKTALITGSNTGIGKVTAQDFFERGARVIVACRNLQKANNAVEDIKNSCEGKQNLGQLVIAELDLSSLASVRKCANQILASENRLDLLINNAGVMMCPKTRTEDGYELQFATNHLGHFLLTLLLLPKVCQSTPARIVNVSSVAHTVPAGLVFDDLNWEKRPYSSIAAYQQTKLANVMFSIELARRLEEANITGVNVYSLHPGIIHTELGRHLHKSLFWGTIWLFRYVFGWIMKTPIQGAQTTIYCAVDEKCAQETGLYYSECAPKQPSNHSLNPEANSRLWTESLKLVGLDDNYDPFKSIKSCKFDT